MRLLSHWENPTRTYACESLTDKKRHPKAKIWVAYYVNYPLRLRALTIHTPT